MKTFIGAKILTAEPLNLGDYNTRRGWTIPANEDPSRPGYLVKYPDNYLSWSPKEVFEEAYRPVSDGESALIATPGAATSFLDRLKLERDDLDARLSKLALFLGNGAKGVKPRHKSMLEEQSRLMSDLLAVLDERIADLHIDERSNLAEISDGK